MFIARVIMMIHHYQPTEMNDGGPYHIETRPLICRAYQWTGFYMIEAWGLLHFLLGINECFLEDISKTKCQQ